MSDEQQKVMSSQEISDNIESIIVSIMADQRVIDDIAKASLIRQVFEKAGYMTSQTFLARFTKELETLQPLMSPEGYEKFKKTALAVAERVTT